MNFGCVRSATMGGLGGTRSAGGTLHRTGTIPTAGSPDLGLSPPLYRIRRTWCSRLVCAQRSHRQIFHCCLLRAPKGAVDRYLNAASGPLRFEAIWPVALQLGYVASNSSIDPPVRPAGYGPETSATFMFPVLSVRHPPAARGLDRSVYAVHLGRYHLAVYRARSLRHSKIGWFQYNLESQRFTSDSETPTMLSGVITHNRYLHCLVLDQKSALTAGTDDGENWTAGAMPIDLMLSRLYDVRPDGGVPIKAVSSTSDWSDGLLGRPCPSTACCKSAIRSSLRNRSTRGLSKGGDGGHLDSKTARLVTGSATSLCHTEVTRWTGFRSVSGAKHRPTLFRSGFFDSQLKNGKLDKSSRHLQAATPTLWDT